MPAVIQFATEAPVDLEPVARPAPVTPAEYKAETCPLCRGPLQERRAGLWCPRDRGWLVTETRGGSLAYSLWQGRA